MSIIVRYTSIKPELINYRGIFECYCTHAQTNSLAHIKCYAAWHEKCAKQTQHREDFDETAIFNVFLQKMVCIYAQLGMM